MPPIVLYAYPPILRGLWRLALEGRGAGAEEGIPVELELEPSWKDLGGIGIIIGITQLERNWNHAEKYLALKAHLLHAILSRKDRAGQARTPGKAGMAATYGGGIAATLHVEWLALAAPSRHPPSNLLERAATFVDRSIFVCRTRLDMVGAHELRDGY
ncbi:hypothetical protein BDK51DRAFT_26879 [Blyttiomyces helicus]|uniref:Uncharacterized protein n=1 Tax=Blyttiomyces helicus TaxID=388810 RepID=A0A4P9W629_9FUNG|nr:hypothetical protein BDK51DRAFT_26879 [Blyttiomyces helicus]|eukprot:RKO86368.1 hypothetical protein BDK51DRAFT_26879 [Blyttiomyces helicus]